MERKGNPVRLSSKLILKYEASSLAPSGVPQQLRFIAVQLGLRVPKS